MERKSSLEGCKGLRLKIDKTCFMAFGSCPEYSHGVSDK